jgi:predicted nucleic acid-binding protein
VKYLLDVNVLLAMHYDQHIHFARAKYWLEDLVDNEPAAQFATCSITELGFVRIAGRTGIGLAESVTEARQDLQILREEWPITFLNDSLGADSLPPWVKRPAHVTDGHLVALAGVHGIRLVTLDSGIPGAMVIPKLPDRPTMVREPAVRYGVESRWPSLLN